MGTKNKVDIVIGDVHGRLKALENLIASVEADAGISKIVFLGDYVDKGKNSEAVIMYITELREKYDVICILGNHDRWLQKYLTQKGFSYKDRARYANNWGSWMPEHWDEQPPQEYIDFLAACVPYHIDGKNRVFVHGGFTSRHGIGHESVGSNYYWDRSLLGTAHSFEVGNIEDYSKYLDVTKRMLKHEEIYVGHTPTQSFRWNEHLLHKHDIYDLTLVGEKISRPVQFCNVWACDTGAGNSKTHNAYLSAMCVNTKRIWQTKI